MDRDMKPIVVTGPAGTGKTFMAAAHSAKFLSEDKNNKVVLVRPNRGCGPTLGALPGELGEKLAPWAVPYISVLETCLGKTHVEGLMAKGKIEIVALEHIRGRTFDDTFLVCDEAQNCTKDELKALVTRMGVYSRIVINGDTAQNDLGRESGLGWLRKIVCEQNLPVHTIQFDMDDCMRSEECRMWLEAFDYEERTNG